MKNLPLTELTENFEIQSRLFRQISIEVKTRQSKRDVHNLRVVTRRLRSMLWVLRGDPIFSVFRDFDVKLKKLVYKLGEQRELDMALKDGATFNLRTSGMKST